MLPFVRLLFSLCCVFLVCQSTQPTKTLENELRDLLSELLRDKLQYGESQQWDESRTEADIGIVGHVGVPGTRLMLRALYKTVTESSGFDVRLVSLADVWDRKMIQVNTPGNRRFTLNDYDTKEAMEDGILSGNLDGALFLVDASEGVSNEIRDLVILIKAAGVMDVVVFVNDDTGNANRVAEVQQDMELLLLAHGFEEERDVSVVGGSLQRALGGEPMIMGPLLALMDKLPIPVRNYDQPFKMHVQFLSEGDNADSAVVYGKVQDGEVKSGDFVELLGFAESVKWVEVKGIQNLMEKDVDTARAGENVGIALNVARANVARGMLLAKPEGFTPANAFFAQVYLLSKDESSEVYSNGETFQIRVFGANANVVMKLDGADEIFPENKELVRFNLDEALVMEDNAPFVLSQNDKIVGYGKVVGVIRQQQQAEKRASAYDQLQDLFGLFAWP